MWIRKFWKQDRRAEQAGLFLRAITTLGLLAMPASAFAQETADTPVVGIASLPRDLSPYGMYLSADPVVKGVLIGLAFASFVTWTVWLAKTVEILFGKRRVRAGVKMLGRVRSIAEGSERLTAITEGEVSNFIEAATTELQLSAGSHEIDGIKERVPRSL
jgi:biopolymer transport protein ExbB